MSNRARRPQRTCLGCGKRENQDQLIRLARGDDGRLIVSAKRGRSGYLHRSAECWRAFLGRKGHYRAFHAEITRAAKEQLVKELMIETGE